MTDAPEFLPRNSLKAWLFNPFQNPEYTKTWMGWITALTKGTAGWPQTWEFFRNTLMSGGLFTGLFVGAMKFSQATKPASEEDEEEESEEDLQNCPGRIVFPRRAGKAIRHRISLNDPRQPRSASQRTAGETALPGIFRE